MKANEAPEKLYFGEADKGVLNIYSGREFDDEIEYTRTDAFIEKAAQWLKENLLNHTYVYEGEVGIGMAVFLENFKKAMTL
jgi:hypothetical protein